MLSLQRKQVAVLLMMGELIIGKLIMCKI